MMPVHDGGAKGRRLVRLIDYLWETRGRVWRTSEIATMFSVSQDTAYADLSYLAASGLVPLIESGVTAAHTWQVDPEAAQPLPPLRLDYAEGAAMYAAARLLSQQQHERNDAVRSALLALVRILPKQLRPHLEATVLGFTPTTPTSHDLSAVFTALSRGWLEGRVVRLTYEPLRRATAFICDFQPYLLEPSGIGYTIYFIGKSDPPGELRTYKLERIRHAELTNQPFAVPDDFDGPELLRRSWRVMYGEGPLLHVKLRFSPFVARRVRETRWHPSQTVTETPDGLIWEADIGDITEMRPWVRGWGADCEALEPPELRAEMTQEARRLSRLYGDDDRASAQADAADAGGANTPDQSLLDDLFGKD